MRSSTRTVRPGEQLSPNQLRTMLALGRTRGNPRPSRFESATVRALRRRMLLTIEGGDGDTWIVLTDLGRAWLAGFRAGQEWEKPK